MGRPKGSLNKADQVKLFVTRIEHQLKAHGGYGDGRIENMACRFLTGEDFKVAAAVWLRLMEYKWGKPGDSEAKEAANNTMNVIVLNQQVVRNAEPRPQLLPDSQAS